MMRRKRVAFLDVNNRLLLKVFQASRHVAMSSLVVVVSDLPCLVLLLHSRFCQVGVVGEDRKFRILSEQEVKDFLDEAN